jgi:hypothetical protein
MLCKKFSSGQVCPYGDKCQFAHGTQELRQFTGQGIAQNMLGLGNPNSMNKAQNNLINYKIVKCKNWEKDHTCKYGAHCSFAHGDAELRNKADNLYQMNPGFPVMMPMMIPPQGMDMNQMQQFMMGNQLMMGMGINPNISPENNEIPVEKKD